ncbi:MAG: type II secretion system F family protein [Kistimonas sp.]|nr:type II secretion system F family protein [Kistimonas sp.]
MPTKRKDRATRFLWEGRDGSGRLLKGETSGASVAVVRSDLRKRGIKATKVRKKGLSLTGGSTVKPADITLFTRQMATMIKAGVPVLQGFDITIEGLDKPAMKSLIMEVRSDVAGGTTLAEALSRHPRHFDPLYCNLIQVGEQSGALDTLFDRVATYKEKTELLKSKIRKAMTYPIAIVLVALVVSGILLVKVVPQFEQVFANFDAELPAFTQLVIGMSEFMQESWAMLLGAVVAGLYGLKKLLQTSSRARDKRDQLLLKIPIIGRVIERSSIARFSRTLSTTFSAGVPLVEALDSVAGAAGNAVFRQATTSIKASISGGQRLQTAMRETGVFPSMDVQMVAIGEESGLLDEMLDRVASLHEEEVDGIVDNMSSLMEPLIMVVLGTLVGGLVVAMYLPIFGMGAAV